MHGGLMSRWPSLTGSISSFRSPSALATSLLSGSFTLPTTITLGSLSSCTGDLVEVGRFVHSVSSCPTAVSRQVNTSLQYSHSHFFVLFLSNDELSGQKQLTASALRAV